MTVSTTPIVTAKAFTTAICLALSVAPPKDTDEDGSGSVDQAESAKPQPSKLTALIYRVNPSNPPTEA